MKIVLEWRGKIVVVQWEVWQFGFFCPQPAKIKPEEFLYPVPWRKRNGQNKAKTCHVWCWSLLLRRQAAFVWIYFIVFPVGRTWTEAREPGVDFCTDDHNQVFKEKEKKNSLISLLVGMARASANRLQIQSRLLLQNITNNSQVTVNGFQLSSTVHRYCLLIALLSRSFSCLSAPVIAVELERVFLFNLSGDSPTSAAVGGNSNIKWKL